MKNIKYLAVLFLVTICLFSSPLFAEEKPYFVLTNAEKLRIIEKAKTIKIGDSYKSVLLKMGTPTDDTVLAKKERNEIIGRVLSYYIVIWKKDTVNELHDQLISIYFNKEELVDNVYIKVN